MMNVLAEWLARKWKGERNAPLEYAAPDVAVQGATAESMATAAGAIMEPAATTERQAQHERAPRRKRAPRDDPRIRSRSNPGIFSAWRRERSALAVSSAESPKALTDLEPGPVALAGGRYLFAVSGEFVRGSVVCLQAQLPGSERWAVVPNSSGAGLAQLLAPGFALVDLPCGEYRLYCANGCSSIQASLAAVPR